MYNIFVYDILRLSAFTRSRSQLYDNFRLDIFVREVRDILFFAHSLVYENYRFTLREVTGVVYDYKFRLDIFV